MSIVHKNISTVNKKSKPKEEKTKKEFNLGIAPRVGTESQPSFVWAMQELNGTENAFYHYRNHKRETCFYVRRYEPYEKGNDSPKKRIVPYSYDLITATWVCHAWEKNRPLFHEDQLDIHKPVIIVEGEKTVLEAQKRFKEYDVVTWSGGSKAMSQSSYEVLKDKRIILFPDNDKPGVLAMHEVAKILIEEDISDDVSMVTLPKGLPDKWDLADNINIPGVTYEGILDSNREYDPEEHSKIWEKINKREDKKLTKQTVKDIAKEYCYVMANDMYNKIGTGDFYNSSQLNNFHSHQVSDGTLTEKLLKDPMFSKAETFVTSAKFSPGLLEITKPGTIPLIDKGTVLNIYIPNYLSPKKGDVKFLIDLFIWLIGEDKWKIIEQWIAYNIQYPGDKMKWAVVLVSEIEGAGKGLLARIISRILGQANVNENANYKHLINTHNTLLIGTQVLVLNEVSLGDFKSKNEGTNSLKNFVADDVYSCNFKGKPMVKLPNFTNILLFSNDITVLGVNNGSRRYFFCKINRTEEELIKITDEGTFQRAWDFADSDEGASALINYFKHEVKIPDITIFKKRAPKTVDLIELIEQSKHPMQKILEHDLTRPDHYKRKIFAGSFTGIITFDALNEILRTTNKDDTEQFKWPSYGDDAIYKFLSTNSDRWNNGETTRQISIRGVKHRFHLLDDSRCPVPDKSYKDLTPKQIETIYLDYGMVSREIEQEEKKYIEAQKNLEPSIELFKMDLKTWVELANEGFKNSIFKKHYKGKTVDQVYEETMNGTLEVEGNDKSKMERIKNYKKILERGIRKPEEIIIDVGNTKNYSGGLTNHSLETGLTHGLGPDEKPTISL